MAKLGTVATVGNAALELQSKKSASTVWQDYRLMLLGRTNDGKTTAAATASEHCPESLPAKKMVDLKDMQWILLDNDGLAGLHKHNLTVDYFDLTQVEPARIGLAMQQATEATAQLMRDGHKKTAVVDSASVLACLIEAKLKPQYPGDKFGFWDAVLAEQMKVFSMLKALPGNLIVISHVTAVQTIGDADQKAKAANKLRVEGLKDGDLKLDISGKIGRFYRNNFSEIWPVAAKGKAPDRSYGIYPYGYMGMESKTKQNCFEKEEGAHLGKLFDKIKAAK